MSKDYLTQACKKVVFPLICRQLRFIAVSLSGVAPKEKVAALCALQHLRSVCDFEHDPSLLIGERAVHRLDDSFLAVVEKSVEYEKDTATSDK